MNALQLLAIARKGRPEIRYATNPRRTAVAAYYAERWIPVAALGIDGEWYGINHELLIDGKPAHGETWQEVTA